MSYHSNGTRGNFDQDVVSFSGICHISSVSSSALKFGLVAWYYGLICTRGVAYSYDQFSM